MRIEEKISSRVKEKYIHLCFDNGLNCYIIPKKSSSASAYFGVNFGSADTEIREKDGKVTVLPQGIAHFLEHKMFETKDGDAFVKYACFGGDANAYTAGDRTCYMFSSTENFYDNLEILLDHVTNASYSSASVKKERDIIIQEVNMYNDNPRWKCRRNMMTCLYGDCSISADPAGSVESVKSITKKSLDDCRKKAYCLSNMALCLCGDIDTEKVITVINKVTGDMPFQKKPDYVKPRLSDNICSSVSQLFMDVSLPIFSVGIRLPEPNKVTISKDFAAVELIIALLFGKSTDFYCDCYTNGLFEEISDSYQTLRNTFFVEISGASKKPYEFFEKIKLHINQARCEGFDDKAFERAKKSLYSEIICEYESSENITDSFIAYLFDEDDMFDVPDIVASLDKKYTEDCFKRLFSTDNMCISVIIPKSEQGGNDNGSNS